MPNAIRQIMGLSPEPTYNTLRGIFSDIANALRACGITGTFTPPQMPLKVEEIEVERVLEIQAETPFTGKSLYCRAYYNGT